MTIWNVMTAADWFLFGLLLFISIAAVVGGRILARRQNLVEKKWDDFKKQRKELYRNLADPKKIEDDMEKGARLREMHDAQRTTLPREDAGPPAVVHRPPLRGAKAGSWRPRNPGSPSKQ